MKELVFSEAPQASLNISSAECEPFRKTRAALARKSMVVWGEHCSECAFPSCYASCEFYTPRRDLHCRRFERGIENVTFAHAPDIGGLMRIHFRQWGKLEGSGSLALVPLSAARHKEARTAGLDRLLAALPLPRRFGNGIAFRLNKRRKRESLAADGKVLPVQDRFFMIEGWLAEEGSIAMTVSMLPWDKAVEGFFQRQFTFAKGYNREIIPIQEIRRSLALDQPFAIQIEVVGEPPAQPVLFGIVDFVEPADRAGFDAPAPAAPKSKTAKCVVWDLDETLWNGTLAEDGIEGLRLNPAAAAAVRSFDARGILNSIASKNDEALAMQALKHFGLDEYFLFPQINGNPKSDSLRRIAELIDIGIDSFVFIDDQPFERGEVTAAHPAVAVMTPADIAAFLVHPLFDVPVTPESAKRRLLYRDEEKRGRALQSAGTDYIGFLRSCSIELDIAHITAETAERVYELTQRTNQLNVTGTRYTREEIRQFAEKKAVHDGYVLRCRDKFGDYGIIGFCVFDPTTCNVEAFFMSCRVQRKRIEHAFFAWLDGRCAATGGQELRVKYRKTDKNAASAKMFTDLGFNFVSSGADEGVFIRRRGGDWPEHDVVCVNYVKQEM